MNGGDSLREQLARLLADFPAEELRKNGRAAAAAILSQLNVVGREEFDAHCEMLARAVVRLREMEKQIARLEEKSAAAAKKSRRRDPAKPSAAD